ncbi:hypothetical protein I5907_08415 [Panacibacter sp. DH6]|uniref:3-hydroxyacyl-CoA dehydrogenase C-terminal domain-containing protein n=1 Tax=Panacibacter microcysteis TaxID=2793269 RepID=A0A931GU38_9BACT|nr:3-hydroxyacyl-CoA dehydrogenase family protein [Panacibacter microcysteis]MBG9376256.1 hypothetical protein [Panacibacter microcysteis]
MRIIVRSSPQQQEEWLSKPAGAADVSFVYGDDVFNVDADVYVDLLFEEKSALFYPEQKPVFVSAVIKTLEELPANFIRINAWNGFLKRERVEVASSEKNKPIVKKVMDELGWTHTFAPDVAGMIAARTIAMIVNEAYFALEEGVSTKENIDTAMKLGTNYPYGPFEWAQVIGLKKIYMLLIALSVKENRYLTAPIIEQEVFS